MRKILSTLAVSLIASSAHAGTKLQSLSCFASNGVKIETAVKGEDNLEVVATLGLLTKVYLAQLTTLGHEGLPTSISLADKNGIHRFSVSLVLDPNSKGFQTADGWIIREVGLVAIPVTSVSCQLRID